jgi:succinyl-diaminopimelate desuccinylase
MDCLDLSMELMKIDSSKKEDANKAVDFCMRYLLSKNLKCDIIENNGHKMLISEIGKGNKTLILNGHLDVVAAKEEQFAPQEADGKLYGRGSADMKAAVAAMMLTMVELKNKELPCKIQLQLVTDEETGGVNCSKYLADENPYGDFVICGEPTNLDIGIHCKGVLQIDIIVNGKSAHGSRPWEGVNAITKAYEIFNNISTLPFTTEKSEFYDSPSINLSKIEGGMVYNKVPDCCKLSLDIRFLPEQNVEEILSQIKQISGDNILVKGYGDPVKTRLDNNYVRKLTSSIEKYTCSETKIFGQHGSADTKYFSKYGIPAVEFGPCGGNWHGDEEYVVISSIYTYIEILKDFIENF